MEVSAFWRETRDGEFIDCPGVLEIMDCTNDEDWPIELSTTNTGGELIGLSLNMLDSIRLHYLLTQRFGKLFS